MDDCEPLGYEAALRLAGQIINYVRRYFHGADGSLPRFPGDSTFALVHAHENPTGRAVARTLP